MSNRLEQFLITMPPHHAARARACLEKQIRVNGRYFTTRQELIEDRIAQGATVREHRSGDRLERPDGVFIDVSETGLNYARFVLNGGLVPRGSK